MLIGLCCLFCVVCSVSIVPCFFCVCVCYFVIICTVLIGLCCVFCAVCSVMFGMLCLLCCVCYVVFVLVCVCCVVCRVLLYWFPCAVGVGYCISCTFFVCVLLFAACLYVLFVVIDEFAAVRCWLSVACCDLVV